MVSLSTYHHYYCFLPPSVVYAIICAEHGHCDEPSHTHKKRDLVSYTRRYGLFRSLGRQHQSSIGFIHQRRLVACMDYGALLSSVIWKETGAAA